MWETLFTKNVIFPAVINKNTGEKTSVQSAANGKLILKLFKKIRLCEAKIATDEKMINLFLNWFFSDLISCTFNDGF